MSLQELDFREGPLGVPEGVKKRYRQLVGQVVKVDLRFSPQGALDYVKQLEEERGVNLFGVRLTRAATMPQRLAFARPRLQLKYELGVATTREKQKLQRIEADFAEAAQKLAFLRNISSEEADTLLMRVVGYKRIRTFDDAIERLTRGPDIVGFRARGVFNFSNQDIRELLERSFSLDAILKSRLMLVRRISGFAVQCQDIDFGNECLQRWGARWAEGYLVVSDRETYEGLAMELEGVSSPEALEHVFKLRASTDTNRGFATVKVHEFGVERPRYFDYLHHLPLSEKDRMRAYFLGIIAHEEVHALQAYGIEKAEVDVYCQLAREEPSAALDHRFVSKYVDRHHLVYGSAEVEVLREDMAEAVRIYLTNPAFLENNFPRRLNFINHKLPFVQAGAISQFVLSRQ